MVATKKYIEITTKNKTRITRQSIKIHQIPKKKIVIGLGHSFFVIIRPFFIHSHKNIKDYHQKKTIIIIKIKLSLPKKKKIIVKQKQQTIQKFQFRFYH